MTFKRTLIVQKFIDTHIQTGEIKTYYPSLNITKLCFKPLNLQVKIYFSHLAVKVLYSIDDISYSMYARTTK
jgi:hypothetical protein